MPPGRWLDLGTGNGVPGIPLLLALPGVEMTLVDSVRTQVRVRHRQSSTSWGSLRALAWRARAASDWGRWAPPTASRYDVVVAKAVGPLATLVELAAPLLAARRRAAGVQGRARAPARSGRPARPQAQPAASPAAASRRSPARPSSHSVCAVFEKVAPCPESIPRREGLARSRPLG